VFGVGVPLLWIWLASQVQPTVGQGTSMLAATLVIVGPLASYIAVVWFAGHFRFAQRPGSERPRMAWTQSRDEIRQKARHTTTFEQIVLLAILIVALGFDVWYFGFAKCSTALC
jgi:thiosulfate reductase cytochrome b subunit